MERNSIAFEQLSDIYGFRILVDIVADCYAAVGVAHTTWPSVMGRFKDYISTPKQNDYRSIHTTVIGPGTQRVELQIRTQDMHEIAEYGIAAHALYKDGRSALDTGESRAYRGLRQIIEALSSDDSEKFLEHTKLELFQDQVFCFTPEGPADRAAARRDGDRLRLCRPYRRRQFRGRRKINGRIAPLISTLHNGDEVLITRSASRTPPAAWDIVVVTGRARAAIRRATREAAKAQYRRPRAADRRARVRARGAQVQRRQAEERVAAAGARLDRRRVHRRRPRRDLFRRRRARDPSRFPGGAEGGAGDLAATRAAGSASPKRRIWCSACLARTSTARSCRCAASIGTLPVRFAPKGGAVPGERIVGIRTPGEGITIYPDPFAGAGRLRRQAGAMARRALGSRQRPEGALSRRRSSSPRSTSPARSAWSRRRSARPAPISTIVVFNPTGPDFREMRFDLEVSDIQHLNAVIAQLRGKSVVSKVERLSG